MLLSIPSGETEVPPIPCHVHAGDVVDGCCVSHGKTEAYFFPPLDVPPYNMELGPVKTRLGFRPDVTKEKVGRWLHVHVVGLSSESKRCYGL